MRLGWVCGASPEITSRMSHVLLDLWAWVFPRTPLCAAHREACVDLRTHVPRDSPSAGADGRLGSPRTRFIMKIDEDSNRACFRNLPSHRAWLCFSSAGEARAGGGRGPAGYSGDAPEGKREAQRLWAVFLLWEDHAPGCDQGREVAPSPHFPGEGVTGHALHTPGREHKRTHSCTQSTLTDMHVHTLLYTKHTDTDMHVHTLLYTTH